LRTARLLHGDAAGDDRVAHKDIGAVGAWDWGPLVEAYRDRDDKTRHQSRS
jgi:hypothetical protein